MSTRKRDTSKKRNAILDAAQEAFVTDGFDNASMDRIADLAGASKRTVYNHFPSKEMLFQSVIERVLRAVVALKQIRYDPEGPLSDQLRAFLRAKASGANNPTWLALFKVTTAAFITHPDLAGESMACIEDESDGLVDWLKAATRHGRLSVHDPELAAEAFWMMASGAFFWPAIFEGPMDQEKAVALEDEFIALFLARYAS